MNKEKPDIETQLSNLKFLKVMGFEVIKANAEQIAINNKSNEMPMVVINDFNYSTPTPHQWYDIDEEIKRLEKIKDGNSKF